MKELYAAKMRTAERVPLEEYALRLAKAKAEIFPSNGRPGVSAKRATALGED